MIVRRREDLSPGSHSLDPRDLRKKKSGAKHDREWETGSKELCSLVRPNGLKKEKEWG